MLQFLRDQKQSISGFSDEVEDPYQLFVDKLRAADPELLEEGLAELDRISKGNRGKWEQLTKGDTHEDDQENGESSFSFGFGAGDDDEEVP